MTQTATEVQIERTFGGLGKNQTATMNLKYEGVLNQEKAKGDEIKQRIPV